MPVFDFNHMPDEKNGQAVCTYTTFLSSEAEASPEKPILILDNRERKWPHHSCGMFTNPEPPLNLRRRALRQISGSWMPVL